MSCPKVNTCPVMEAVAKSMFGFEGVPVQYQRRMVTRAAKEAHKIYSDLEKERDELRELVIECVDTFKDMSPDWARRITDKLKGGKTNE